MLPVEYRMYHMQKYNLMTYICSVCVRRRCVCVFGCGACGGSHMCLECLDRAERPVHIDF